MTDDALWVEIAGHRDRLLGIARRRCPTRQDAEDVVSDAMLTAATYEALDRDRLGPLLTALTIRFAARAARRRGVEQRALPRLHDPGSDDTEPVLTVAEIHWLDAVAAHTLTAVERSVLLYRADGFTAAAAAGQLGITERAAASALTRARRKLLAAWRATLGVFGLDRLRRLAPAGGAAVVVAVAVVTAVTQHMTPHRTVVVPLTPDAAPVATYETQVPPISRPAVAGAAADRPRTRPVAPLRPDPRHPEVTRPTVDFRGVDVPMAKAGSRGATVTVSGTGEPVGERVARCIDRGPRVVVSERAIGVVCNT